jgi:hypothetical protein
MEQTAIFDLFVNNFEMNLLFPTVEHPEHEHRYNYQTRYVNIILFVMISMIEIQH